jgi:hypothetical protein
MPAVDGKEKFARSKVMEMMIFQKTPLSEFQFYGSRDTSPRAPVAA